VTTIVARVAAVGEIEALYRQDGDRLWRALYAFAGDEDVASDAAAEAFAQALRRGRGLRPGAAPRLGHPRCAQLGVARSLSAGGR
jgi:DNA-directed RNA polymerase specialized sigma24 family protein